MYSIKDLMPNTQEGVNTWIFYCILAYTLVSYLICGFIKQGWRQGAGFWGSRFFGGANLGFCSLLAPALVVPELVTLLGSTPLYLTIAGLFGVAVSVTQLASTS